jgi:hypothetical protein
MTNLLVALLPAVLLCATTCQAGSDRGAALPPPLVQADSARAKAAAVWDTLAPLKQLDGRYVGALQISGGPWSAIGPQQFVEITFTALGLVGIGQFDVTVSPQGPVGFDVAQSRFTPVAPFVTLGSGVEKSGESGVRFVGANLARNSNGTVTLGTLRLRTPAAFTTATEVRLAVTHFSIGPSSTRRDSYTAEQLGVGATINGR